MHCGDSLNDLIGVWDGVDEINWNSLPQRFVLKCNHGCGMNIICSDKTSLDIEETKNRLNKWMKMDWGKESIEPHYSKIKPKIICEKFIENTLDKKSSLPPDIKIHCFNGIPKVIAYYSGRGNDMHGTFYDVNWNKLDFATKEGPVIFKQKRVGKNKTHFYIYKFRTMKVDTSMIILFTIISFFIYKTIAY